MYLCGLVPILYGISLRFLVVINESDRQKNGIDCMDELFGCTCVNECLYCMESPGGFLWKLMNWIDRKSVLIVWMHCMDVIVWMSGYIVWTIPTGSHENEWIGSTEKPYWLYGWTLWMDSCEWVAMLYGLSQWFLVRMNESDWHKNFLIVWMNYMDVLVWMSGYIVWNLLTGSRDNEWIGLAEKTYWLYGWTV